MHVHDNAFFARLPLGCVGGGGKPWSQWKLLPRDTEYPLSRYHGFFCGATGKTLSSSIPSRLPFASLPTPYTLSSWGCKRASLQTPKRSPAALHSVLLKLLLKTPGCQPSNASTLRSGLTRSILGAFRRLPTSGRVLFAAALHILSLGVHECRLPAFRPLFKPLNPPQRLYTLSC